jgi:predicted acyl esterase
LIQKYAGFYLEWLSHSRADEYWLDSWPQAGYEQIYVPAHNITGWYDIFLWSTCQNYTGMKQLCGTGEARQNQRLIIGPWTHMIFSGSFPECEFGWGGSAAAIDLPGIHLT